MKVVYVFLTAGQGLSHLINKILPQMEAGKHGSEVVGMVFFDGNQGILNKTHPYGDLLLRVAERANIVLMAAESSDLIPKLIQNDHGTVENRYTRMLKPSECTVITIKNGEQVGCYPNLYTALADNPPDHLISL